MLSEEKIIQEISFIASVFKKNTENKSKGGYHSTYDESVHHARELSVHADGDFPYMLIDSAHPNETDAEFDYRKANYQAVTMPAWGKALKTVNRIWNPSNFSIKWADDDERYADYPAKDYFNKDFPTYQSILKYFSSVITDYNFKDPNALVAVKPKDIPMMMEEGEEMIDQSKPVDPIALVYESKYVMQYQEDVFAMFLTQEKVHLEDDEAENTGMTFEIYDNEYIYKVWQIGKKEDYSFIYDVYYRHCLGFLPVFNLSGIYTQYHDTAYLKSYFNPALPNLNQAVISSSTLFMSEQAHAFPQKYEYIQKCNNEGCVNGEVIVEIGTDKQRKINCPSCQGTGLGSPLKVKQIPIPDALDDSSTFSAIPSPPMGYVTPPEAILEFSASRIENNINFAFSFVGIDVSTSQPKGGEVALSKMIDREETFAFLLKIRNDLFPLYKAIINTIGMMRYSVCTENGLESYWNAPEIVPPVDFSIRTELELIQEIKEANEAGIDLSTIRGLNVAYTETRFNPSGHSQAVTSLIYYSDSLTNFTNVEINSNLAVGRIQPWQALLHDKVLIYIQEAELEHEKSEEVPTFFDLDITDQREIIQNKAKADAETLPVSSVGSTQSILNASTTNNSTEA